SGARAASSRPAARGGPAVRTTHVSLQVIALPRGRGGRLEQACGRPGPAAVPVAVPAVVHTLVHRVTCDSTGRPTGLWTRAVDDLATPLARTWSPRGRPAAGAPPG